MDNKKYKYTKISVYCTKDEMEKWNKTSQKEGLTLSNWAREAIIQKEKGFVISESVTAPETPETAELIAENKRLKEENVHLKSIVTEKQLIEDIDTMVLDVLSNKEWKDAFQIAKDIGLYKHSLEIIASKSDDPAKRMSAGDTIWKSKTDVELTLYNFAEKDIVESKKTKGAVVWRLK